MAQPFEETFRAAPGGAARRSLVCLAALAVVMGSAVQAFGQTESLIDRITNERMRNFEERLTRSISGALNRYVSRSQYVLSVKVIWNRDVIPAVRAPGLAPDRQKLPGFPIFVTAPGAQTGDDSTPPFVRMVVKVLVDETLPEYYERFIRKIVPIVARFDSARGDQVLVLKETFPVKEREAPPLTLPEKELMETLGTPLPPGQLPPQAIPGRPGVGEPRPDPIEAAQIAYEEGRYTDALRIVQSAFQQATTNQQRSLLLGMEGSLLYTMKNQPAAQASWKRSLVFDPTNLEVQRVMQFLETRQSPAKQEAQ
jgi:hypothetical protein